MNTDTAFLKETLGQLSAMTYRELQLDVGPIYSRGGVAIASWSSLNDKELLYAFFRLSIDEKKRGRLEVGVTRGSTSSRVARVALKSQVIDILDQLDQVAHRVQVTLSPHEYGVITTLNVNLNRHERSWDRAIALVSLCMEIERVTVQSLSD